MRSSPRITASPSSATPTCRRGSQSTQGALYAKNVFAFLGLIVKDQTLTIDASDEIVKSTLLTRDGCVVHPSFMPVLAMAAGD